MAKIYNRSKGYAFVMADKRILADERLSDSEKILLINLIGLPGDWEFSINGLATQFKKHKQTIQKGLHKLESLGYLHRGQQKRENGKFGGSDYYLFDSPEENTFLKGEGENTTIIDNSPNTKLSYAVEPPQLRDKEISNSELEENVSSTGEHDGTKKCAREAAPKITPSVAESECKSTNTKQQKKTAPPPPTFAEIKERIASGKLQNCKLTDDQLYDFWNYWEARDWIHEKGNNKGKPVYWTKALATWNSKEIAWQNNKGGFYEQENTVRGTRGETDAERQAREDEERRMAAEEERIRRVNEYIAKRDNLPF